MPPAIRYLRDRLASADRGQLTRVGLLACLHLSAFAILLSTESDPAAQLAFVLTWGALNFFWLALLRRPLTSAALSLALIVLLIMLSQLKQSIVMMTATFVDVMIIDFATFSFLMTIIPGLAWKTGFALASAILFLVLLWRLEPFRIRRTIALAGCLLCLTALFGLSLAVPADRENEFDRDQYVSKFARSAAVGAVELATRGVLEADASIPERASLALGTTCHPGGKPPHIIMVFDESSFDATMMPNVTVPADYRERFRSSDGRIRSFVVEGAGGPSWYTEYNVLAGLSVRSYGRFAESVTRLAGGRVERGLPHVLKACGYATYSIYSWFGAFVGARAFHTTTGIEHFIDAKQLGTRVAEPDRFYYDHTIDVIARARANRPVFVFVYLAANHFAWNYRYRPDLLPGWTNTGNPFEIDEYLRRQQMSVQDYAEFKERLAREFPDERFFIVRFGDHQPFFARRFIDPTLDETQVAAHIRARDPRYFTTYYATDGVNFSPLDLSSALDTLDAPYLPLVVLEGAGLPLDPSFAEQKKILSRCRGMFYLCGQGAEARRFNRLLINAGLIHGF
ncbi:MAG TPA: sulfatase-like hydrolase/transferase [Xanthobacteraceae bacterium]